MKSDSLLQQPHILGDISEKPQQKLKIVYLANFGNIYSDATEKHIAYAFEQLGHTVIRIEEKDFDPEKDLEKIIQEKGDLFLFHHANGINTQDLLYALNNVPYKKVFWYFDKVRSEGEQWMQTIAPFVDYGFLTDGTWLSRHVYKNLYFLPQGIGNEDTSLGTPRDEYKCDLAFLGSIYGERMDFVKKLKTLYGDSFKVYNNVFNRDLYDFCASCKILVAPPFPGDHYYWSSRIYMTLGSGGVLAHPVYEGLKKEFTPDKHFIGYNTGKELIEKLNYYLDPKHAKELQKIRMAGYKRCIENYTYQNRAEQMLNIIYDKK